MKKEVLLIFKTHLDIGYTDYAKNVVENYINTYIPNAIKVGYELKGTDTPFIWTVGSWLIHEALKRDTDGKLEQAVRDGIITWHSLPMTTHTELMSKELFEYGLSLSDELDKRFSRKTIASKMTDVPGHTVAMVPLLKKHDVEFLHIGVNPATPLPDTPRLFRWKCGDDMLNVMYQEDYGTETELENCIISFAHTGDNLGPQSKEEIIKVYEEVKKKYPDLPVRAATLDDIALKVRETEASLPVFEAEIGDTWIHGAGTDPLKVANFRALMRKIEQDGINTDLSDSLLLVPEHTWGMCVQKYFDVAGGYSLAALEAFDDKEKRARIEKSWDEQREYVRKAEKALGVSCEWSFDEPSLDGYTKIDAPKLSFEISWQLFDNSDYERYKKVYMRITDVNRTWALWDFTKPGLEDYVGGIYTPSITAAYQNGSAVLCRLDFDEKLAPEYGLPHIWASIDGNAIEITFFGRKALRMPNAFWFKPVGMEENWQIRKLGRWISADNVVGSPLIAATDYGVKNSKHEIETLDATLVAPYGRRLLDFEQNPSKQDLYFNLYNNIWDTNFPMWYTSDTRYRFIIK